MQEYVAGFMFDAGGNVALVRKLKPDWQRGLLNGIGGKVERGECIYRAMIREFYEETGFEHGLWDRFCSIQGENSRVHFFRTVVAELPSFPGFNDVGETIECWYAPALREGIVPNLRWLIPLAMDRTGFIIVAPQVA